MKMLFRQKFFSWFDAYDIYDEFENVIYSVKGQLSWGHCLKIFDPYGCELATVKERLLRLLPEFDFYLADSKIGRMKREFTFLKPSYNIDFNGWRIEGNFTEWNYRVYKSTGETVAEISKQLFKFTDTYVIEVDDPDNALCVLMLVLAIDAEKCSRDSS